MYIGNRLWCGESQACQLKSASASGLLGLEDLVLLVLAVLVVCVGYMYVLWCLECTWCCQCLLHLYMCWLYVKWDAWRAPDKRGVALVKFQTFSISY